MRAKLLDGRSQTILRCDLFSVFVIYSLTLLYDIFYENARAFLDFFIYRSFAQVWKTSLLISRTKSVAFYRIYCIKTEQSKTHNVINLSHAQQKSSFRVRSGSLGPSLHAPETTFSVGPKIWLKLMTSIVD